MDGIDATALSNARLAMEVGTAVAVKAKNVTTQQGEAVLSLLQAATDVQRQMAPRSSGGSGPQFHLGRNVDVRA
jgi:hypothetical protein